VRDNTNYEPIAKRILELCEYGLVCGVGTPEPGKMCVEALVKFAMGEPHGDNPPCVAPALRRLKIRLNDSRWSSDQARAKGLRRLAVAQLGSAGVLDEKEFAKRCATLAIKTCVPNALRTAASVQKDPNRRAKLLAAAEKCEREPTRSSALDARSAAAAYAAYAAYAADAAAAYAAYADDAAYAAAYAADAAIAAAIAAADAVKRDEQLAAYCEGVVQILVDMGAPGCQWLALTESAS